MDKPPNNSDQTKEKVLDEAERLFAEKGFSAVSVREITGAAGVHLSAVNYYFGSKKNLYLEVFRARVLPKAEPFKAVLDRLDQDREPDLHGLIKTLVSAFLKGGLDRRPNMVRHAPLFFREMANPGEAFDLLVNGFIKPTHDRIAGLLGKGIGREVEQEKLLFYALTLMALMRHLVHSKAVIQRIFEQDLDQEFIDRLIDYLTEFVLHGLAVEEAS